MYIEEQIAPNELTATIEQLRGFPNSQRLCRELLNQAREIIARRGLLGSLSISKERFIYYNYWKTNLIFYYKQYNFSNKELLRVFYAPNVQDSTIIQINSLRGHNIKREMQENPWEQVHNMLDQNQRRLSKALRTFIKEVYSFNPTQITITEEKTRTYDF